MASSAASHTYRCVDVPWHGSEPPPSANLQFKAWCYPNAQGHYVYIEARRVFGDLYSHRMDKDLKLSKIIQVELARAWDLFHAATGFSLSGQIKPSLRAYAEMGSSEQDVDPFIRNEWSMTTLALLWAVCWLRSRRRSKRKGSDESQRMAGFVLRSLAQYGGAAWLTLANVAEHSENVENSPCGSDRGILVGGYCSHVRFLQRDLESFGDHLSGLVLLERFAVAAAALFDSCQNCGSWLGSVLEQVANGIEARVLDQDAVLLLLGG